MNVLFTTYNNATITNCYNYGTITINTASTNTSYYGGLFGEVLNDISFCGNIGNIQCNTTTNIDKFIGGIAAINSTVVQERAITNSFNEGNIYAANNMQKMNVGGILCENKRTRIVNCYAFCDLEGTIVSGIVYSGINLYSTVNISNCYYYPKTTPRENTYGIAGPSAASYIFTIDHCYYPIGYILCGTNSTSANNNSTLSNATTLETGGRLSDTLNANIDYLPEGYYYRWKNSTSTPIHVVFDN